MAGFLPGGIGFGRPAGIPDSGGGILGSFGLGGGGQDGGLLAAAKPNTWDIISMVASGLQDANAGYRGEKGGNLDANLQETHGQRMRAALLQGLSSEDPTVRQRAYQAASLYGIDTKPFQQQQASQALPKLLSSMQPQQDTVASLPAPLPTGPQFAPQTMDYQRPGMAFGDALANAPPELQAQLAPKYIDQLMKGPDNTPHEGVNPATGKLGQYVMNNGKPEWLEVGVQAKAPTTRKVRIGTQEVDQEFDPSTGNWSEVGRGAAFSPNIGGAANTGNVQSVQPLNDGTLLIVKRDGTTAHVTMDGSVVTGARFDPQTHFNMNAAGAAGKAAGTAAEALPATKANFDIINKTLAGLEDPKVKEQANHALGWQGKATFGASIPGVTSDFNARYGQLEGQAFLNAFNSLRGGGQITEVEGSKATSAIARLQKAQTPDEFYSALKDAKQTFSTIYQSANQRAQRGAVVPSLRTPLPQLPPQPGGANPARKPSVSNW